MKNVNATVIGHLIEAHKNGDDEKFDTYAKFIEEAYIESGDELSAKIIHNRRMGIRTTEATLDQTEEDTSPVISETERNELARKANEVLSLCVDEWAGDEYTPINHHIPLKDGTEHWADEENWNLTNEEREFVSTTIKELYSYAESIVNKYSDEEGKTEFFEEILPHWLVFPHYPQDTVGWRVGIGEAYKLTFVRYFAGLSSAGSLAYKQKYPRPDYMKTKNELIDDGLLHRNDMGRRDANAG